MSNTERLLILVRHSQSAPEPGRLPADWPLSPEGRRRCRPLARLLSGYPLQQIVTSENLRALETGRLVAAELGLPCSTAAGLHEHERGEESFTDRETFLANIQALFARPEQLVFGTETAAASLSRFQEAVHQVIHQYPGNLAVVTHGTVLSLFVAHQTGRDAYSFWQTLDQPSCVLFALPAFQLLKVYRSIT